MSSSKQEGGRLFSSRILSRDRSSMANASFRVYYSLGAGTVPFVWETKPGTPKSNLVPASGAAYDDVPPPMISPPPSYQSRTKKCARRPSSSPWPSRWGWMTRWPLHIGRWRPLSPSSSRSPTTDRDRWLGPDSHHGAVDRRRPRRRAILLCF